MTHGVKASTFYSGIPMFCMPALAGIFYFDDQCYYK